MTVDRVEKIEAAVAFAAAIALAAASAFAGYRLAYGLTDIVGTTAVAVVAAAIGFTAGRSLQRTLAGKPGLFPQPIFELVTIAPAPAPHLEELVLTETDKVVADPAPEPLILDDVLADVSSDSRVVRLFDAAAMPTPGQLKARIDRHLDGGTSHSPSPDASEALLEALADLRRSLR
jgi:hypothetical protein